MHTAEIHGRVRGTSHRTDAIAVTKNARYAIHAVGTWR